MNPLVFVGDFQVSYDRTVGSLKCGTWVLFVKRALLVRRMSEFA